MVSLVEDKIGVTEGDKCYNCGKFTNHLARECPEPKKTGCYVCGSEEHLARQCPDKENDQENEYSGGGGGRARQVFRYAVL